jgi:hypothetical protein
MAIALEQVGNCLGGFAIHLSETSIHWLIAAALTGEEVHHPVEETAPAALGLDFPSPAFGQLLEQSCRCFSVSWVGMATCTKPVDRRGPLSSHRCAGGAHLCRAAGTPCRSASLRGLSGHITVNGRHTNDIAQGGLGHIHVDVENDVVVAPLEVSVFS